MGRYIACQWLKGTLQPSSVRTYLSPIRKRHVPASFPDPFSTDLVADVLAGFTNARLDIHGSKVKRVALPANVLRRLARLVNTVQSATIRTRLTAVVAHYFIRRQAKDVLLLVARDVQLLPDGGASFQICRN